MIISASRRTDIPALFTKWFMNRIWAGYCAVPNPFNPKQVSYVSLKPENVEVIVFWTRNPRPLFSHLAELDQEGYRYYFQYTIMGNPRSLDPKSPSMDLAVKTFCDLVEIIGPEKVIWRYDPIVLSNVTDTGFHQETYGTIARQLRGYTHRSVISLVDIYAKSRKRLQALAKQGLEVMACEGFPAGQFDDLMQGLVRTAAECGLEISSCAEELDLASYGIRAGKCVDDVYIKKVFGLDVKSKKDPGQRKACQCVFSRDIGMYESCVLGCQYCYATSNFQRAKTNYSAHRSDSPSLLGWYDATPPKKDASRRETAESCSKNGQDRPKQKKLF